MEKGSVWEVFRIFLKLGCTSFGGPVAHLGYFRDEFVQRRRWLTEDAYGDLVALCQFMPGPASSQVGLCIGYGRGGYSGALAAWLGFTLPSAILLILFALGITRYATLTDSGLLQGLKIVAVAVVLQAVWGMGRQLCPDKERLTVMAAAVALVLLLPSVAAQMLVILLAGMAGYWLYRHDPVEPNSSSTAFTGLTESLTPAVVMLGCFFVFLFGLPVLAGLMSGETLKILDGFYRSGALVFGGGHVVLPLLQAEVVQPGWVESQTFLAGYGAAQAVPGPLFTFGAFLGASLTTELSGWSGGLLCLAAIFLPSFFLVFGVLPFWQSLREKQSVRAALKGINAGVVGLLLAALYQPVWVAGIHSAEHFVLGMLALLALAIWKLPPWLVVIAGGLSGWAFSI